MDKAEKVRFIAIKNKQFNKNLYIISIILNTEQKQ